MPLDCIQMVVRKGTTVTWILKREFLVHLVVSVASTGISRRFSNPTVCEMLQL